MQQALSQPQSTPVDESQSPPIKVSRKKEGKTKINTKETAPADEQEKSNRIKWPPSDEVLLTKGYIFISEDPIIGNNQNIAEYWARIADYYNNEGPKVPRIAHNLRSHWHHIKTKRVMKDCSKHDNSSKVHGHQAPKRQKSNSTWEYTGSTNTTKFGISLDDDDDDIQAEQEPPSRPMGRDKAKSMGRDKTKAKGKAMSSYDYEAKKLSLVEELAETNRVKKQAIKQFDQKIDKFYELEQRKIMTIRNGRVNYGLGNKPPETAGSWPIIGHLHLLGGSQVTHKLMASMADKFGPIFTIKLGVHRVLVVRSSEMAKECLATNDRVFSS
ncbi:hypothetical protein L1987_80397 [Smallanthus sonchifolius]|uniref:Uncharacterized protein n=1 Tax=Smallanthus sonchifolius TaxID=185202 RepID=A0ACB8YMR5_9ASTR|nr:hypothetical protein L1987_80397 [Smallanthus sonchifolius]